MCMYSHDRCISLVTHSTGRSEEDTVAMATQKCVTEVCILGFLTLVLILYVGQRLPAWKRILLKSAYGEDKPYNKSQFTKAFHGTPDVHEPGAREDDQPGATDYITLLLSNQDRRNLKLRREHTFRINPKFRQSMKMQQSDWTSALYHPEIRLLINEELLDKSEYERLLPYLIPYGYLSTSSLSYDEVARILSLFPAAESIFDFPSSRRRPSCLSCAVVGNGGILKGSGRGLEIDDHDMVFRLNNAIRRGHERDVGNRTTHYFFFDRSLRDLEKRDVPKDNGIKYVFIPCEHKDYLYIRRVVDGVEPKLSAKASDICILHPDFIRYAQRIWYGISRNSPYFRPSTGSLMLLTALHAGCDRVQVYGMGYQSNYTLYYFDDHFRGYNISSSVHYLSKEIQLLRGLHESEIIDWYQRLT